MEMAMQQLSEMTRNFANNLLKQIITNNMRLNAVFMPDEVEFCVPSYEGGLPQKISRAQYQQEQMVLIGADMRYATMNVRIQEADEIVKMALSIPQLSARPPFLYEALKDSFEARGKHKMIPLMGPAPENYPIPFGATPPMLPPGGNAGGVPPKQAGGQEQMGRPQGESNRPEPEPKGGATPPTLAPVAGAQGNSLATITR
jgi:hypothetical protein